MRPAIYHVPITATHGTAWTGAVTRRRISPPAVLKSGYSGARHRLLRLGPGGGGSPSTSNHIVAITAWRCSGKSRFAPEAGPRSSSAGEKEKKKKTNKKQKKPKKTNYKKINTGTCTAWENTEQQVQTKKKNKKHYGTKNAAAAPRGGSPTR
jgi:hypothetical protein